jgi:hypothetical protein
MSEPPIQDEKKQPEKEPKKIEVGDTFPHEKPWGRYSWEPDPSSKLQENFSPKLQELLQQDVDNRTGLLLAYQQIHDDAKVGKPISAQDFTGAEEQFNEESRRIKGLVSTEIRRIAGEHIAPSHNQQVKTPIDSKDAVAQAEEVRPGLFQRVKDFFHTVMERAEFQKRLETDYAIAKEDKFFQWKREHPEVLETIRYTKPVDEAFRRSLQYNGHRKNLALEECVTTQQDLVEDLLKKNRGIAIGDIHTFAQSARFVADNMATLKASGVDTLYIEFPDKQFQALDSMSAAQCRQFVRDRKYGDLTLPTAAQNAIANGTNSSDDMWAEWVNMIATAKEHGIRVVNVDKKGEVRNFEIVQSLQHRVASTNWQWAANIETDRKQLEEKNQGGGKFVVFGGGFHFLRRSNGNGLVDDALSIPVVLFERREQSASPAFRREISPNGADFYLPGGTKYYDTQASVRATDADQIADGLEKIKCLPGVTAVIGVLRQFQENSEKAAYESTNPIKPVKIDDFTIPPDLTPKGVPIEKQQQKMQTPPMEIEVPKMPQIQKQVSGQTQT